MIRIKKYIPLIMLLLLTALVLTGCSRQADRVSYSIGSIIGFPFDFLTAKCPYCGIENTIRIEVLDYGITKKEVVTCDVSSGGCDRDFIIKPNLRLKKIYYENWVKERGAAEKTFKGHTTDYFIDEVPVKKSER